MENEQKDYVNRFFDKSAELKILQQSFEGCLKQSVDQGFAYQNPGALFLIQHMHVDLLDRALRRGLLDVRAAALLTEFCS